MPLAPSLVGILPAEGVFDTITGLPVHPLVAHAGVVLLPLSALGLIALVAVSKWRDRFGILTLLGMAAGTVAAFVAKESGEALANRVGEPQQHASWGDILPWLALLTTLVAILWFWMHRQDGSVIEARAAGLHGPMTLAVGLAAAGLAVGTLVLTTLVGHSGAEAVWGDKISTSQESEDNDDPAPTESASPTDDVWMFTMADVATHDNSSDCWSVVDAHVYDLTSWIGQHEGGAAVIEAMCGVDATAAYMAQHKGEEEPEAALSDFALGALATENSSPTVDTISLADVAKHASASDCWSVVDGKVYDLTKWIARHPGGEGVIEGMCGIDATNGFMGQHEGDNTAAASLAPYEIGTLG